MELRPYRDTWDRDDPHANFKAEVAGYTSADPLSTPVECLVRYVLVRYAASGADTARLRAYGALKSMIASLALGEV